MAFANDPPRNSITWPAGAASGQTRIVVGADTPAILMTYGIQVAILFYIKDAQSNLEVGYLFIGPSNILDGGANDNVLVFGQVLYPVPGDPNSATVANVKTNFQMNLDQGEEFPAGGWTKFKDFPIRIVNNVPSVSFENPDVTFSASTPITVLNQINDGYVHVDRIHAFTSGSFDKSVYPLAKRITVSIVAGGGGGGGAGATGAGQWSYGDGGGGGEYAQATYDLNLLNTITNYTVGAGGAGGSGAAAGTNGGDSTFDAAVGPLSAGGGGGGAVRPATSTVGIFSTNTNLRQGGFGGTGGHLHVNGKCGGSGQGYGSTAATIRGGDAGSSYLSGGTVGSVNGNGAAGFQYGGGGSGASRAASLGAVDGGDGAAGAVIIDVYA